MKVKSQGVIKEGHFSVTSSTVPMVGNVLVSASSEDIAAIFSRGVEKEKSVTIGRSLMENQPIRIPINDFFLLHISVFSAIREAVNQILCTNFILNYSILRMVRLL